MDGGFEEDGLKACLTSICDESDLVVSSEVDLATGMASSETYCDVE